MCEMLTNYKRRPAKARAPPSMTGMAVAWAAPAVAALEAEDAAAPVEEAIEEPAAVALEAAELASAEPTLARLLPSDRRDEATAPVAVASDDVMLARVESTPLNAVDSALPMDESTELPSESTLLMRAVPDARIPPFVVVCPETRVLRAATKTTE